MEVNLDHDYNDVAAFLGIDPGPETPPLGEAAADPLNINADHLEPLVVPSQFQAPPPPQQSSSSFSDGFLHNLHQSLESRNTVVTPYDQSFGQFGSNEPMIGSSSFEEANVHSLVELWPNASSVATYSNQPIWGQNQFNMGSFHPGASSSTQEQPPQQSSSSFAAGVLQNLYNLGQTLESRNTVFTPYQLQPQRSFEEANVHSLVRFWPQADSNQQQQLSSNQPIWNQNQLNMGYFHPGSALYSTEVAPNQHASSTYQHGLAIEQIFETKEEANAYREDAIRKYLIKKSRRKDMQTQPIKNKNRSDGAKKKKRNNKGRFIKKVRIMTMTHLNKVKH